MRNKEGLKKTIEGVDLDIKKQISRIYVDKKGGWNTWKGKRLFRRGISDRLYDKCKNRMIYINFVKDGRVFHNYCSLNGKVCFSSISYPINQPKTS